MAITYRELHRQVCKVGNMLKAHGIRKGDRVCIYMPMVPELAYAVLGCARIGAVHSVVFAGFSSGSLVDRMNDSGCKLILTADGPFVRQRSNLSNSGRGVNKMPSVSHAMCLKFSVNRPCKRAVTTGARRNGKAAQLSADHGRRRPPFYWSTSPTGNPRDGHTCAGSMFLSLILSARPSKQREPFIGAQRILDGSRATPIFFMARCRQALLPFYSRAFPRGRIWVDSGRL